MYTPALKKVISLGEQYNLIPVTRCIMADLETPIRVFQHFYEEQRSFLLESVEGGVKWARYSFIGTDPFLLFSGKDGTMQIESKGSVKIVLDKPLEILKELLSSYSSPSLPGLPRFTGGAVGFFGYDLLQYYEKLPKHRLDDLLMNDLQFMFCDQIIVFDHFKQQINIIANVHIPAKASEIQITQAYEETCSKIDATIQRLHTASPNASKMHNPIPEDVELGDIQSNITKAQYISNVEQAKEYIRAGDIFQVVLSQRFEISTSISPFHVYRILRTMNPSPYMYYLKMDDLVIVGTSPEMLVRVEEGRVQTVPIAGTRPRGKTPEEDLAFEKDLLADPKELAEHLMLVDLGRNDIGRVSEFGSVKCDTFMEIERYSHVMHIVSNVSGRLRDDKDFFDAFISCLPAGTVSGAPKLRAMEIIAELENQARGPYAGAIGYLGFSGNMDTCITIRTIIFKGGKAYVQAGAGIVWDSVPESEYEETVNKAKALLKSIRTAEIVFTPAPLKTTVLINQDYYN